MKILYNARVYTLDKSRPLASAIVVDHGEVLAVGGDELLSAFIGAEKQDLGGRAVLPGLTDAHLHLQYYALALQKIDCETDTLEECLRRVEDRARSAKPGEWILGHGWNQNVWGSWPCAADLDRIAPNHPVYLTAKSLHAAWANTAALRLADINAATPDPKDGKIQRDDERRANRHPAGKCSCTCWQPDPRTGPHGPGGGHRKGPADPVENGPDRRS